MELTQTDLKDLEIVRNHIARAIIKLQEFSKLEHNRHAQEAIDLLRKAICEVYAIED